MNNHIIVSGDGTPEPVIRWQLKRMVDGGIGIFANDKKIFQVHNSGFLEFSSFVNLHLADSDASVNIEKIKESH